VREQKASRPLIREKENRPPSTWATETVAYDLVPGMAVAPRVVRAAEQEDARKFEYSGLSANGRLYWWSGPRDPDSQRRVELWDVAGKRRILRLQPPRHPGGNYSAGLLGDDRYFWVAGKSSEHTVYDLVSGKTVLRANQPPAVDAPGTGWLCRCRISLTGFPSLSLSREGEDAELELYSAEGSGRTVRFSPDGRYLAWASHGGTITVADIEQLRNEVTAFMSRLDGR